MGKEVISHTQRKNTQARKGKEILETQVRKHNGRKDSETQARPRNKVCVTKETIKEPRHETRRK